MCIKIKFISHNNGGGGCGTFKAVCKSGSVECEGSDCSAHEASHSYDGYCSVERCR